MKAIARSLAALVLSLFISLPAIVVAQDPPAYSEAEIDQMLAPIALYPDTLLSQILMASTYPLEVVQASRWSQANPGVEGEAAVSAVADEDWDPSVKAMVAFPQILARMDEDLDWTQRLGEAFMFQEGEVMDRVQVLRQRAYDAGNLQGLQHVRVSRESEVIIIEPASPQVVYVPYYNPRVIYGGWWWPAYEPYYWEPPGRLQLGVGFYWGSGIRVSPGFFFSTVHWPQRHILIVDHYRPFYRYGYRSHRDWYASYDRAYPWRHDARHRRGLVYRDRDWQARPPQHIGRPPAQTPQRPSILRGNQERGQAPSSVQRPLQQRHTGPRDSAERTVPIRPRAGEQQFRGDRGTLLRSTPAARERAPAPVQQRSFSGQNEGAAPRSGPQLGGERNGGMTGGSSTEQRRSILR